MFVTVYMYHFNKLWGQTIHGVRNYFVKDSDKGPIIIKDMLDSTTYNEPGLYQASLFNYIHLLLCII